MRKICISMSIRSILRFILGASFLVLFLLIVIYSDFRLLLIFGFIFLYLIINLVLFSFTKCVISDTTFYVRGDYMFNKDQQIQKKVLIKLADVTTIKFTDLEDHMNTNGQMIKYKYKYGDERFMIYGLEKLRCLEIRLKDESVVRFITNKFNRRQIEQIVISFPVPLNIK